MVLFLVLCVSGLAEDGAIGHWECAGGGGTGACAQSDDLLWLHTDTDTRVDKLDSFSGLLYLETGGWIKIDDSCLDKK